MSVLAPPPQDELELLIREARARQRRRQLGCAVGLALVSAAALSIYSATRGGEAKSVASSVQPPNVAAARCNSASGWRLTARSGWSEPTGQNTDPIALIRNGSTSCTLIGYPTLLLRDANGKTIPFRYTHHGDTVVTSKRPEQIRVGSGHSAFFLFNKYRCDLHATSTARWLLVRLPGVQGWLRLRMAHYPIINYCPAEPSITIAVSPIVARLSQAAAPLR